MAALAQPAPPLEALKQTVEQKNSEWDALARTIESKLARMLPCDPRVRTSIEEVSRASEARLAALSQYLQALSAQARADSDAASKAVSDQELALRDIETGRAESEQQRIAVEAQLSDLNESLKRRPQLADAQKSLAAIAVDLRQHGTLADQEAARRSAFAGALRDLQAALVAREKAIQAEVAALTIETARWGDYYAMRIARANTECSITNQSPSKPARKKQQQ